MLPSLYISHGSPKLMIMNNKTTEFLKNLPSLFSEPKYILVISAHWVTQELRILYRSQPSTIHDFYGFEKSLYDLSYNASSSKAKTDEIVNLLESNHITVTRDYQRPGFDHGVWSPLSFMYPQAHIPVLQLSLPYEYTAKDLLKLGEVLSVLREDTLIISSGSLTHNLFGVSWDDNDTSIKPYAKNFRDWVIQNLEEGNEKSLINFEKEAPNVEDNHPSLEHFMPLFVNIGSSKNKKGQSLHSDFMYSNLSMETIAFKE